MEWEGRVRAHLVAFQASLRDGTSSRRSHMVSSVSFPRRSTKHWPTKAVVESGGVQVGQRGLRACASRHGNLSHLIMADRQTDRHPPPHALGQTDGPPCHIARMGGFHIAWTDRWAPHLLCPLDRQMETLITPPRQTDRHPCHSPQTDSPPPTTSHSRSQCVWPVRGHSQCFFGCHGGMWNQLGSTPLPAWAGDHWLPWDVLLGTAVPANCHCTVKPKVGCPLVLGCCWAPCRGDTRICLLVAATAVW